MFSNIVVPDGGFRVAYADPAWTFRTHSDKANRRPPYDLMSLDEIRAMPIMDLMADDSALLMWAIDPLLDKAIEVGRGWGFTFKTVGFYWAKSAVTVKRAANLQDFFPYGTGYWTRANPELCLLFTRGQPRRKARDVPRLIVEPKREHSRKPDIIRHHIERLLDGPYLELFSRHERPGWTMWGNHAGRFSEAAE